MLYALRTLHCEHTEVIATDFIEHDHIKRSCCRSLLVKPSYVETIWVWTSVNELVDSPLVAVEGKADGPIYCGVFYQGGIVQGVRVDVWCVKRHQVYDVHNTHL